MLTKLYYDYNKREISKINQAYNAYLHSEEVFRKRFERVWGYSTNEPQHSAETETSLCLNFPEK